MRHSKSCFWKARCLVYGAAKQASHLHLHLHCTAPPSDDNNDMLLLIIFLVCRCSLDHRITFSQFHTESNWDYLYICEPSHNLLV
eukprot:COSAG02_NODE_367_length_23739_cov_16.775127_16_plen_85_part_00